MLLLETLLQVLLLETLRGKMLSSFMRVLGVAGMTTLMPTSFVAGECDITIGGEVASSLSRPYYRPCPCELGVIGFSLRYPPSTVSILGMVNTTSI